jgi:hypothetical protein
MNELFEFASRPLSSGSQMWQLNILISLRMLSALPV